MKTTIHHPKTAASRAFTLVEMLSVIAVIGIIAAMVVPLVGSITRKREITLAQGQLAQIQTAIEEYHTKLGYYPPDNYPNYATNQLFYELVGTTLNTTNGLYAPLNGSTNMLNSLIPNAFSPGAGVSGFMNSTKGGPSDDVQGAVNCFPQLRSGQFLTVPIGLSGVSVTVLGNSSLTGPIQYQDGNNNHIVPWQYNSSHPTNNPSSYDLWIDIRIGGQTNRISNWNAKPIIM